jgi:spermidine/putrescine transport system permease protein
MTQRIPKWLIAVAAAVYAFLHVPLLVLVVFSFNDSKYGVSWQGFTLQWYQRLFERSDIIDSLKVSLEVGLASTVISTFLGTLLAMGLARHKFSGRAVMESLLYVPVVTPEIVVGISLLLLFGTLRTQMSVDTPSLLSIIIAHVAFNISFVTIVVRSRLEGMDRNLEEAAMILGADEFTAFWKVTVPQLWPGILSGALLAFIMSFDDYVITSLLTGPGTSTLPIVVYTMARKNIEPSINAISTIILVVTSVLIWFADRLEKRDTSLARK